MDMIFEHVALIGIGLIGSSLARLIRREGLARRITAASRTGVTRQKALDLGLVDAVYGDPAEAVRGADLVVICTPIGVYGAVAEKMRPGLGEGAIVTDVGSVKRTVIDSLKGVLPDHVHFIPAHPVAGTEHSGPESGFAELFRDRWCILTPLPDTDSASLEKVRRMWTAGGMTVEEMDPDHHDRVLAITSHLPHLIAYTIVGTAADLGDQIREEVIKYSASGFRDFTRIAGSDPVMWRDIFLNNRSAVLETLQRFSEDLTALQRAIRWEDGETLENLFTRTRDIRRGVIDAGQDEPEDMKRLKKES